MPADRSIPDTAPVGPASRISIFYVGFFLATGVGLPFWPVWLASRGLDPGSIGALLAICQWAKIAANVPCGIIADRARDPRRFMLLLGLLYAAGYLLCLPAHGFAALLLPNLLAAMTSAALLPLTDATTLALGMRGQLDYGRVRLWGTISFIVTTLAVGPILTGRSSDLVLYLLIGASALTAASCAVLPRFERTTPRAPRASWRVLNTPRHLVFLAAATLVQSSHAVYYGFGTLQWQRLGLSDTAIAWLWAEGAIAEVVLFYAGARVLRRCSPLALLAIGGAGGLVRWSFTAWLAGFAPLCLIQPLHALTFAAGHLGAMHYLARSVPPEDSGKAQSIYTASVNGIGLGIASLAAGVLYQIWGGGAYFAMAAMAALGAALAVMLVRYFP